jgi:hypothetical protein
MIWNFFAIGHGKGEVDGARTLLKREVRKEQIKPQGKTLWNVDFKSSRRLKKAKLVNSVP